MADKQRLSALSMPPVLSAELTNQMENGMIDVNRLAALGMPTQLAKELAEQINGGAARLSISVSPSALYVGGAFTITVTVPAGGTLSTVTATAGGTPIALTGSGNTRTGTAPAEAGPLVVTATGEDADGNPLTANRTVQVREEPVAPTAPGQFGASDWTVTTGLAASQVVLNVSAMPSDGGSPITALQYTFDGGNTWTALTGTGTGSRTLTMPAAGASYTFAIRAVNAVGPGAASTSKSATSGASGSYEFETDIIILAYGQSNEQAWWGGAVQDISATLDQDSSGRIRRWDASTGTDVAAVQPMAGWPSAVQYGPARSFAAAQNLLPRQNPARKIIIVNCAVANTQLTGSTLGVGGSLYGTMIQRMTACLAAFPGAKVVASFTQGESDASAGVTPANYIAAVTGVVNGIRALSGAADMSFFVHQMTPERTFTGTEATQAVRRPIDTAHKTIPLTVPNTYFVATRLGYYRPADDGHTNAAGHRLAGQFMAEAITLAPYWTANVPAIPAAPAPTSGGIRITVPAVQPPAYVIEYRASGSADPWTEQVVFPNTKLVPGDTFDTTVAGSGNREVRLKARSYAGTSNASSTVIVSGAADIEFGAGQITVNVLDAVASPSVTFGAGQLTITA